MPATSHAKHASRAGPNSAGAPLHFNAFLMSTGHHEASWRLPESDPHAATDLGHFQNLARIAERGTFDSLFLADSRRCGARCPDGPPVSSSRSRC